MIPKNAITMVGEIERCWLFAYRAPFEQVAAVTPHPLQPVRRGEWGFINIVVSKLAQMRPLGIPGYLGMRYWHVAYRVPVCYRPTGGQAIEGLYFLRSDADSPTMVALGNLLTDFKFHRCGIDVQESPQTVEIAVRSADAPATLRMDRLKPPCLDPGSPFADLDEAQAFLKYKPAGITVGGKGVQVLRITRDEAAWKSRLLRVDRAEIAFLSPFDATLEVCYEVEPIHYRWNRAGRGPYGQGGALR